MSFLENSEVLSSSLHLNEDSLTNKQGVLSILETYYVLDIFFKVMIGVSIIVGLAITGIAVFKFLASTKEGEGGDKKKLMKTLIWVWVGVIVFTIVFGVLTSQVTPMLKQLDLSSLLITTDRQKITNTEELIFAVGTTEKSSFGRTISDLINKISKEKVANLFNIIKQ